MLVIDPEGVSSYVHVLPNLFGHMLKVLQSVVRVLFTVCGWENIFWSSSGKFQNFSGYLMNERETIRIMLVS
jgi:hypothetical protein